MNRTRTQGFTLIEVLVVIAIISILATILLPSFNASRKKPYDVATLQCGKAIVAAQVTYTAEHSNMSAASVAQLNNGDVNEQCAGVEVSTTVPGITGAGNGQLFGGGPNYGLYIWNTKGTAIYSFERDNPNNHFLRIN